MLDPEVIEAIALRLLDEEGMGAIWRLHQFAASMRWAGQPDLAEGIIQIADAVEREWQRRAEAAG